jgi:non-specific serine/threonine protein kinase
LAIAVAESLLETFEHGCSFVDLTQITQPSSLSSLLAAQLALQVEGASPLERVKEYLADRQVLLVLDNFEHVLPAASLVADLLDHCPELKVLVTSRETLRLRWEQRMPVSQLATPNLSRLPPAEELSATASVALFVQRASAVNMNFDASAENLREIAALCVRLEGVPLAIELAAARTNVLSPAAILERLDLRGGVLQQQVLDAPARHQSIRAVMDWSYQLLSEKEQVAFRRLGVLVGEFSLEAATAMTAGDAGSAGALDLLSALIDKGFVLFDPTPHAEPRYRLLETVRAYALEQLRNEGEKEEAERAHAHYYVSASEEVGARLRYGAYFVFSPPPETPDSPGERSPWPAALDRDYANLRAALTWAQERSPHVLMRLACALARHWWVRGYLPEGIHWLEVALEKSPEAEPELRSRALGGVGIMYRQLADLDRARPALEEAVSLARTMGDTELLASQLIDLAGVLGNQRLLPEATALVEEAAELSEAVGDRWGAAVALTTLGVRDLIYRKGEEAEARLTASLPMFRALGDLRSSIVVEYSLARAIGLPGDVRRALPFLESALRRCGELGQATLMATALECTAYLLSGVSVAESCARLLGAAEALRERGYSRTAPERDMVEDGLAVIRANLSAGALAAALADGAKLSGEQAIDEARTLVQSAMALQRESADEAMSMHHDPLNPLEHQVLALLANGCTNKQISHELGFSEHTAKKHVSSVTRKLGARRRVEAVSIAAQRGLL